MDIVEIAPPYDHADITSQLGARVIMDTLATLVEHGHLGTRLTRQERQRAEHERDIAAGITEDQGPPATSRRRRYRRADRSSLLPRTGHGPVISMSRVPSGPQFPR